MVKYLTGIGDKSIIYLRGYAPSVSGDLDE